MTSTNQDIWKILDSDISIQKNLKRDVINIRGLAKFLMQRYNLNTSLDSVISAIRRYESEREFTEDEISGVFKGSKITTKNGMVCLTLKLDAYEVLKKVFEKNTSSSRYKFRIITGPNLVKVLCDNINYENATSIITKDYILNTESGLSEVSVCLNQAAVQTRGVLARMSNELSINNINISEMIVCPPDVLIYVKEKDLVKTHETLIKMCE